ncbi:MAG: flagellar basal body-associated FliL family protein [Nitrospinae bacterium]|nr:flagellar basal body-associated FliL family protein [Nitrospinota bacterium]
MAEQRVGGLPDLNLREAEEIERLLKEEEERAIQEDLLIHPLKRLLDPKLLLGISAAVFLVWAASWAVLSFMEQGGEALQMEAVKPQPDESLIPAYVQVQKPNIYPLKPFFVPIRVKNRETGRFLHVTAHLVLSNRRLHKDIDKVQPLIRQSVYSLLSRKKAKDFEKGRVTFEEKVKREILTASNSFLLSGTGTIINIVFTEFVISPS